MAVYEPRMDWLRQQLDSLEAQTYPNLRLYIRDDCSPTVPFEQIANCVKDRIRSFPFEIRRNERNLGSNGTFEQLTREAEGDYFAYCDQDDVWLPEKLTVLRKAIEKEGALLVCSDMYVIDGEGKQTADSITKARKHHIFKSGEGLAPHLLITNFVTGCTMLVDADQAKAAVPFCPYMVHDHFLALWCADKGKVVSLPQPLIRYRIHAENQTLMMAGVFDKATYMEVRIRRLIQRLRWLQTNYDGSVALRGDIDDALKWAMAREGNFSGRLADAGNVMKYSRFGRLVSIFEIVMSHAPESLFMKVIRLKRDNVI